MAALTGFLRDNTGIYVIKDPDANLRYALDFVNYLNSGDSISTATVTIGTITGDTDPLQHPTGAGTDVAIVGDKVTLRVEGGTDGNVYPIKVKITTAQGDTDSRVFRIVVKDKQLV